MQSDPRIGIELPLRILVWADADGVLLGQRIGCRPSNDAYGSN